jgi:hypothetical protein
MAPWIFNQQHLQTFELNYFQHCVGMITHQADRVFVQNDACP